MATKKELAENQIRIQEDMQRAGFNVVTCGNCGTVLLHRTKTDNIECFCGTMALSDCPDLYYNGIENNVEFNEEEGYFVEFNGEFYQSVFPTKESEKSQLHYDLVDALNYMTLECEVDLNLIKVV